ncbi:MAG TPA: hypothetical protein VH120_11205 [Gemmataceae bacterium]|jgi:hypothetical protein|nr:hypothetical protein [Gemmataceae bacterium]
MTATQNENRPPARGSEGDDPAGVIREHVLRALGRPADNHRVIVRRLWPGSYRVNVLVGPDVTTTTIAHSYFLVADDDGTVTGCIPPITRRYGPAVG